MSETKFLSTSKTRGFLSLKNMVKILSPALYGYWEEHEPHYFLVASHDAAYEKPHHIRGADYNFSLMITSRDNVLNHRVLAEFSGKVSLQALREPRSNFLREMLQGMSKAYPVLEMHGRKALI